MQEALEEESAGIIVNGTPINNIRYADDTVLLASNIEDLRRVTEHVQEVSERYGLKMNINKTKFMLISKNATNNNTQLTVNHHNIETVQKYKYLGTWVNDNNDFELEIRSRIEQARNTFIKMKRFFCSKYLSNSLKIRMVRCYIFSVLLYGIEASTLKQRLSDKIEAFEMWIYRRILKISWTERVTNEEVLRRMGKEKEILTTIKTRKLEYLGHVMRGARYKLLHLIIQGKITGKRSVGRRRISWLRNLRDWSGCTSNQLFKAAVDKTQIVMMIANLR